MKSARCIQWTNCIYFKFAPCYNVVIYVYYKLYTLYIVYIHTHMCVMYMYYSVDLPPVIYLLHFSTPCGE